MIKRVIDKLVAYNGKNMGSRSSVCDSRSGYFVMKSTAGAWETSFRRFAVTSDRRRIRKKQNNESVYKEHL